MRKGYLHLRKPGCKATRPTKRASSTQRILLQANKRWVRVCKLLFLSHTSVFKHTFPEKYLYMVKGYIITLTLQHSFSLPVLTFRER